MCPLHDICPDNHDYQCAETDKQVQLCKENIEWNEQIALLQQDCDRQEAMPRSYDDIYDECPL